MQEKWTPADYGNAMLSAVSSNAESIRQRGGKLYFNGWWRNGSKANVVLNADSGSYYDFKEGTGGGAKVFASEVFGLSLPDFMLRFGGGEAFLKIREPEKQQRRSRLNPQHIWGRIKRRDPRWVTRWLEAVRGIPPSVSQRHIRYGETRASTIEDWPGRLRPWITEALGECPAAVFPIFNRHGAIANLHLRMISDGKSPWRRFLPGIRLVDQDGVPLFYGDPLRAIEDDVAVVCEGAIDTELFRSFGGCSVIGLTSSSMAERTARFLCGKTRGDILIVPHLDDSRAGQLAAAKMMAELKKADIPARLFDWTRLLSHVDDVGDVGDVVAKVGWQDARELFLDIGGIE